MFSSSSYAGWTQVTENKDGEILYVDFERMRKVDGYVYWWGLREGVLSRKVYRQGDCKLFRYKSLSYFLHNQPMGEGTPISSSNIPDTEWTYPSPNSSIETILKSVCSR
jgi:hypothetical protein